MSKHIKKESEIKSNTTSTMGVAETFVHLTKQQNNGWPGSVSIKSRHGKPKKGEKKDG